MRRYREAGMKYAQVGDLNMCYELRGDGPPLVLIMGLTANMDWWDPETLDALYERYRVLVFDNRGAGRTETPETGDFSCAQMADDTAGLMEALGIERAHVVGVSMGGMIAQELALSHPDKVDRLVLCVTFCGGKHTVYATQEVLQTMADTSGTADDMIRRILSIMFPAEWLEANKDHFDDFRERYLRAPCTPHNTVRQFMGTTKLDTYDRLPSIAAPTLVMCGAEDVLIPPVNSRTIAGRIPGAKLIEYPGSGHAFQSQLREEFVRDLTDFLG
jgi:pimeloyl-ACP methyl ester carboxylesterase